MAIDWFETIRGVEVKVYADNFVSDEDVGLGYGPDELWAVVLLDDGKEGEQFELTDEESDRLFAKAAEISKEDYHEE
jgi:hypothetical protein